jgi:hypothetical protein
MGVRLRNAGRPGIGFCALSAVDLALWDLKARVLELPLADVVGRARDATPVYGSGGFTSYSLERIREQLGGWVADGIPRVKMKVSREPDRDPERLDAARQAIGDEAELYVSNGALSRKQALRWAERFRARVRPGRAARRPPGGGGRAAPAARVRADGGAHRGRARRDRHARGRRRHHGLAFPLDGWCENGDVERGQPLGFFFDDVRHLSEWLGSIALKKIPVRDRRWESG